MRKIYPILCFFLISVLLASQAAAHEIHDAARAGDLAKVSSLLEADPSLLEIKNENGKTPLSEQSGQSEWRSASFSSLELPDTVRTS